mgnify:FL=1
MERDRIKFKSNVEGKIQFLNKLCTVKIDWCHLDLFGNKEIEKSETKLFSTQEKAEQFLVNSGFLYGVPYPFKICGWYYIRGFKFPVCDRFLIATTEMTIVDAEELCSVGECI